jgi:hypothetical protein
MSPSAVTPDDLKTPKGVSIIYCDGPHSATWIHFCGIFPGYLLKHTAISWAMQAGEEPWQVADFFATSLDTILKVYGHHHPEQQAAVASRIGRRPQNVRA